MELKDFLFTGVKTIRISLGIPVPIEDLLKGFLSLVEKIDQLGEDEVLKVALYWALYKAVEDALKEFEKEYNRREDFQNAVKNLFKELDKRLTALGENKEIFELSKFSLNNFYGTEAVGEILRILKEVVDKTLKPMEDFPAEQFKGLVEDRLKLFFWIVVEEDENSFKKLLDNFSRESIKEKLRKYYIDRYLSKIVKEFAVDPIFGEKNEIPLEKVYIEPHYGVYDGKKFKKAEKSIFEELYPDFREGRSKLILILGFPGEGKTSLARKIIYDFKTHRLDIQKVYLLKLREVEDPEELLKGNPKAIKQELERLIFGEEDLKLDDFKNSVVILDGLDELLMTKNYLSNKGEEFIEQLLKFLKNQSQWRNLQIVITSRLGYVEPKNLYKLKGLKILKLEGFDLAQQKEWIKKYSQYHPDKGHYLKQIEDISEEIRKLLSQPVLLYIVISSGLDLSKIKSKIDIYEALLDAVVKKKWDEIEGHPNVNIDKEKLNELLGFLAFLIFKHKREYIRSSQLWEEEGFIELLKESFENYLSEKCGVEFNENQKKEISPKCLKELLKGLLILFYIHEKEVGGDFALEFYHKSIQEYLTAEYFYLKMLKLPDNVEEAENIIWDLFSHRQITPEIREFLEQIIEKRREEDREKQNQFLEKMKKVFPSLLEKDFVVKPCELVGEKPLNKPLWCFGNLWIFAGKVSEIYLEELKDIPISEKWKYHFLNTIWRKKESYKDLFTRLLIFSQGNEDTFLFDGQKRIYFSYIDLSKSNLTEINLIGFKLKGILLEEATLNKANLIGANLIEANLNKADLRSAFLIGAFLTKAKLINANLKDADLRGCDLSNAILVRSNFQNANLSGANLENASLINANLSNCDLTFCNLVNANLTNACLLNANLRNSILIRAIFDIKQIKKARNWDKAIYDDEMKKKLGLA